MWKPHAVESIWGDGAGQQALFGVLSFGAAALVWRVRSAFPWEGEWAQRYVRFIVVPALVVLGIAALIAALF